MELGFFAVNVPQVDFAIDSTASEDQWVCGMEGKLGHTVRNFNVECRFLGIEVPTKDRKNADYRLMLTPDCMIGLSICNSQAGSVDVPREAHSLIVIVQTSDEFARCICFLFLFLICVTPVIKASFLYCVTLP